MDDIKQLEPASRYLVRGDRRIASTNGRDQVELLHGTTLELVNLDERWNHTHAMILSTATIHADFRVCDGPTSGAVVRVVFHEEVFPEPARHQTDFPLWLTPIPAAAP